MVGYVQCLKCQTPSMDDSRFCYKCGEPLAGAAATAPPPSAMVTTTYVRPTSGPTLGFGFGSGTPPPAMSYETRRSVDRTRTGVALLAAGVILALFPIIGIIGSLLSLAGAILVILGRKAFGAKHARNVVIAVALFVGGLVGSFFLGAATLVSMFDTASSSLESALTNALNTILVGAIVIGMVTGLASVLFLWELLNRTGRILILASYVVGIGLSVAIWAFIMGQIGPALAGASASPPNLAPLLNLDLQITNLRYLGFLPALLSAAAAYVAWSRIESGQIPKKGTGATRLPSP